MPLPIQPKNQENKKSSGFGGWWQWAREGVGKNFKKGEGVGWVGNKAWSILTFDHTSAKYILQNNSVATLVGDSKYT